MIIKRRVKINFVGIDRIKIVGHCNNKEFDLNKLYKSPDHHIDLETIKSVDRFSSDIHFGLRIVTGNGSLESPYTLGVYRINYDKGRIEAIGPTMAPNRVREATFETSVWDEK